MNNIVIKLVSMTTQLRPTIITRKLNYGQGGECQFSLKHRDYHLQFQTIWEDYCLLTIEDTSPFIINENGKSVVVSDELLEQTDEKVKIKFQLPQDYTFFGQINGSISHLKNNVSGKLRSNSVNFNLKGNHQQFQWQSLQTPKLNLVNRYGLINLRQATFQDGIVQCEDFKSQKILFSSQFLLESTNYINVRSIVAYGDAVSKIYGHYVDIQSLSGKCMIESERVKIDRLWANPEGISIKTNKIQSITVETGTGKIEAENLQEKKVKLGRMHKGRIVEHSSRVLQII